MWPVLVVVRDVLGEHPFRVTTLKHEDPVQAFSPNGPNEPPQTGIRPRCADRRLDDLNTLRGEHRVDA
jgi:hypothetical protein